MIKSGPVGVLSSLTSERVMYRLLFWTLLVTAIGGWAQPPSTSPAEPKEKSPEMKTAAPVDSGVDSSDSTLNWISLPDSMATRSGDSLTLQHRNRVQNRKHFHGFVDEDGDGINDHLMDHGGMRRGRGQWADPKECLRGGFIDPKREQSRGASQSPESGQQRHRGSKGKGQK